MKRLILYIILLVGMAAPVLAQTAEVTEKKPSKAWEFGLGASVFQFNRASFSHFSQLETGYLFDLKLEHAIGGGNIYIARELNQHFYLDLQGTLGAAKTNRTVRTKQNGYIRLVQDCNGGWGVIFIQNILTRICVPE